MRGVTERFADAITGGYKLAVQAILLPSGDPLYVTDGSVTADRKAASRGRMALTFAEDGTTGLVPESPTDPLAPYGGEVQIWRGIEFPDGPELIPQGIFRLEETSTDDSGDSLQIKVSGVDRSARIIEAVFEDPFQIASGVNIATAIQDIIEAVFPTVTYDFAVTSITTPALVADEGDDRWDFCQGLAEAAQMELYFDGEGVLVMRPPPVIGTASLSLSEGAGGALLSVSNTWTRQGVFNRVVVTGENTTEATTAPRGVAIDDNPLSPTYFYGPYGRVTRDPYSSPFIVSDAQAAGVAATILGLQLGTAQQITFDALVHPAIEPGDVALITRTREDPNDPDNPIEIVNESHILDAITCPLGAGASMSGESRALQAS